MLVLLAILAVARALPTKEPSPISVASTGASCSDPNGCRTLWDIIRSCLFTMFLCTWVSVHPNIPGPDEKWPRTMWRRAGIMLAMLIAPELMIAWALRQRVAAHKLAKQYGDSELVRILHDGY
jgi:hypothetical protein